MKIRHVVSFLTVSVLLAGATVVVNGAGTMKALAAESQRYSGVSPKYLLVVLGVLAASYLFGYVYTRSKLV